MPDDDDNHDKDDDNDDSENDKYDSDSSDDDDLSVQIPKSHRALYKHCKFIATNYAVTKTWTAYNYRTC